MTTTATPGTDKRVQIWREEIEKSEDTSKRYRQQIDVSLEARAILEQYSGLKEDEVVPHVADIVSKIIRACAIQALPYPCIGELRFLEFTAATHPSYQEILLRLKSGETFLDAGCCLGQYLRKLVFDGAPSSVALYGIDIVPAFFDLGYELFRDREKMFATFAVADLTQMSVPSIDRFRHRINIIRAQSLFHLFTLEVQKMIAQHLVALLKPEAGSIIVGSQMGTQEAGNHRGLSKDTTVFIHSLHSFGEFWEDVGTATGSKWEVVAHAKAAPQRLLDQPWTPEGAMILIFKVIRQ